MIAVDPARPARDKGSRDSRPGGLERLVPTRLLRGVKRQVTHEERARPDHAHLADRAHLDRLFAAPIDRAFHLAADGRLAEGDTFIQESVIGSRFIGRYHWLDRAAGTIIPHITGTAHITAETTLLLDERDPFCWGIHA